ncbi:hypothetical protein DFH06DRAFT_1208718 [Mycena polygramma]|nr:hypothetical protein DFH06DRAFT_1208718 [Mycena polygramma]
MAYQAHAGPGPSNYYMQQQQQPPPPQFYGNPGPSANPNTNPNPNGYAQQPYQYPMPGQMGSHHPGSPRLNGHGRGGGGAGYSNNNINPQAQSARGHGHGHAPYPHAHAHAQANYRPPPLPYAAPPYAHQHPHAQPHPHQMAQKYAPPQGQGQPYPYVYAQPPPVSAWGQPPPPPPQHQQQHQQQQHQQQQTHQQQQQPQLLSPLSPLPKDVGLGLSSPLEVVTPTANYYNAPPPPPAASVPEQQQQQQNESQDQNAPPPPDVAESPSSPDAPLESEPEPEPESAHEPTYAPSHSHSYGSIPASLTSSSSPLASPTLAHSSSSSSPNASSLGGRGSGTGTGVGEVAKGSGGWALWSRRPHNPSHAPGVIISPAARPPAEVVAGAMEGGTPPASPRVRAAKLPSGVVAFGEQKTEEVKEVKEAKEAKEKEKEKESAKDVGVDVDEGLGEEPMVISPDEEMEMEMEIGEAPSSGTSTADTTDAETRTPTTAVTTVPGSPASVSATAPKAADGAAPPSSSSTASPSSLPTETNTTPASAPAPPPAKKSWASLLRPPPASSSSAPGAPSTSAAGKPKWGLPTSSVVGFSVPAAGDAPPAPVTDRNRAAVLALLSAPPPGEGVATVAGAGVGAPSFAALAASASAASAPTVSAHAKDAAAKERLTPRGLINTGNMCFANAVLQVLVYCAPFADLFAKLHSLLPAEFEFAHEAFPLPSDGTEKNTASAGAGEKEKEKGERGVLGAAPLVRATGAFLREFMVKPAAKKGAVNGNGTATVNGASVNGANGGAKGKARAAPEEREEEELDAFIPTGVYDALKGKKRFDGMRGGHQEDAEEFLGFFLDTLEEELLAVVAALSPSSSSASASSSKGAHGSSSGGKAVVEEREEEAPPDAEDGWLEVGKKNRTVVTRTIKTAESPITRIFGGKFRSTLRAPGQKDSVIVEDWRSLRLDIQREGIHTIADALALLAHPQSIQMTHPARPGVVVEASQQVLIEALPPVLVLHVKRFCYDTAVNGVVKVGKQIRFGAELEVGGDVIVPSVRRPARYKLFGVIYHHGVSASGGHYTLDVMHPTRFGAGAGGEGWVRVDDELVSDVRPADVFGASEREDGAARCAYLLFYRRIR